MYVTFFLTFDFFYHMFKNSERSEYKTPMLSKDKLQDDDDIIPDTIPAILPTIYLLAIAKIRYILLWI